MSEQSILDARLAEIDRRLRSIQSGLAPAAAPDPALSSAASPGPDRSSGSVSSPDSDRSSGSVSSPDSDRSSGSVSSPGPDRSADSAGAASPAPPPARAGSSPSRDVRSVQELAAEVSEIVSAHERLLASARELLTVFADALARVPPREQSTTGATVGLRAGPFAGTEDLRRFERALLSLPEVRGVEVREYSGEDRVIVDVHLTEPNT